jgi:hypothetical protein
MPSPYRREELIADTATLVYLLSGVNLWGFFFRPDQVIKMELESTKLANNCGEEIIVVGDQC